MSPLLASWCLYFVGVIVYLIFEPLGLDFELPSWPSDLQNIVSSPNIRRLLKIRCFRSDDGLDNVLGPSWHHLSVSWGRLGGSLGALGGFLGAPGGSPATLIIILGPS